MSQQTQTPVAQQDTTGALNKSGEAGIRTLGTLTGTPVFKTGAIGRSATSPSGTGGILGSSTRWVNAHGLNRPGWCVRPIRR